MGRWHPGQPLISCTQAPHMMVGRHQSWQASKLHAHLHAVQADDVAWAVQLRQLLRARRKAHHLDACRQVGALVGGGVHQRQVAHHVWSVGEVEASSSLSRGLPAATGESTAGQTAPWSRNTSGHKHGAAGPAARTHLCLASAAAHCTPPPRPTGCGGAREPQLPPPAAHSCTRAGWPCRLSGGGPQPLSCCSCAARKGTVAAATGGAVAQCAAVRCDLPARPSAPSPASCPSHAPSRVQLTTGAPSNWLPLAVVL